MQQGADRSIDGQLGAHLWGSYGGAWHTTTVVHREVGGAHRQHAIAEHGHVDNVLLARVSPPGCISFERGDLQGVYVARLCAYE